MIPAAAAVCRVIVVAACAGLLLAGCGDGGDGPAIAPTPERVVQLADDGGMIELPAGERFLLQLGEDYEWQVQIADEHILRRVDDTPRVPGSQGIYQAAAAGRTTLSAVGDPPCRKATPPCAMPSRSFSVTIVVH